MTLTDSKSKQTADAPALYETRVEPIGELRTAAAALGDGASDALNSDDSKHSDSRLSQAGEAFRLAVQRFARLRMNRAAKCKSSAPDGAVSPVGLTLMPPAAC